MIENFITFIFNLDILKMLWIIFWILLLLGAVCGADSAFFFGFIVFYVMLFPIYRRIDIFILGQKTLLTPNIELAVIFLMFLIILWIILFGKFLGKFSTSPSWLENFSKKFLKIWKFPIDIFVHVIIFRIEIVHNFVKLIIKNATKYLNSNAKIILFLTFTIFLPRIIALSAIWYDLHIEKAFVWSPILGLLLVLAVITKLFFLIFEHYGKECLDDMFTYVYFDCEEMTEKQREMIINHLGPGNYYLKKLVFRGPRKKGVENISLDFFFDNIIQYYKFNDWFKKTKMVLNYISQSILFWFISLEIITQIIIWH